jgi:hypothetical protein
MKRIVHRFETPVPYHTDFWYELHTGSFGRGPLLPPNAPQIIKKCIEEMSEDTPILHPPETSVVRGDVFALEFWSRGTALKANKLTFAAIYGITEPVVPKRQYGKYDQMLSDAGIIESEKIAFPFIICHGQYHKLFNQLGRLGKLTGKQDTYHAFPFSIPNDFVYYPWASEAGNDWLDPSYLGYSVECKKLIKEYMEDAMGIEFDIHFSLVEHQLQMMS